MFKSLIKWFIIIAVFVTIIDIISASNQNKSKEIEVKNKQKEIDSKLEEFKKQKETLLLNANNLYDKGNFDEANSILNKFNDIKDEELIFLINKINLKIKEKKIEELLQSLKTIKADDIDGNIKTYIELRKLTPENKEYLEKIKYYSDLKNKKREEEISKVLSKMTRKHDDFTNITWYQDKSSPIYLNSNTFHLYFSKDNLRLKIQYYADDWLFINKVTIKTDKEMHILSPEFKRDNEGGKVWEWADIYMDKNGVAMIQDIINSSNVKIRYEGSKYRKDIKLSKKQIQALKNTLFAFKNI